MPPPWAPPSVMACEGLGTVIPPPDCKVKEFKAGLRTVARALDEAPLADEEIAEVSQTLSPVTEAVPPAYVPRLAIAPLVEFKGTMAPVVETEVAKPTSPVLVL